MTDITRKNFIFGVAAAIASMSIGSTEPDFGLDDIYDDKYYDLQGGPYKDTGGVGAPGKDWRRDLLEIMRHEEHCRYLERFMDHVERNGFYFTVSLYFPHSNDEWTAYGHKKIPLTRKWLTDFYNKHKMDA